MKMNSSNALQAPNSTTRFDASKAKSPRPRKPNYNYIHRNLLPIELHPLPVLIPHNPLSLIAIALSYVTQLLSHPSHRKYKAYFSSATSSVHVTDSTAVRKLWEMGFFGKGSLSRSEPTWLETQKRKGGTNEEHTLSRRAERRSQKLDRARKEQEIIAEKMNNEMNLDGTFTLETSTTSPKRIEDAEGAIDAVSEKSIGEISGETANGYIHGYQEWKKDHDVNGVPTPPAPSISTEVCHINGGPVLKLQRTKTVRFSPTIEAREFDLSSPIISPIKTPGPSPLIDSILPPRPIPATQEHLQLSLEEAFFLSYGLGALDVFSEDSEVVLPPTSLLSLFRRHSYYPSRSLSVPSSPDDPFMLSYAAYHHYRSLGWVVRSGVKFSVDLLLYNRGPAFSHAEFSVVLLPSYTHEYWRGTDELRKRVLKHTKRSWWWLHAINRVQAQVMKTLVLCYVDIPPPLEGPEKGAHIDISKLFSGYRIRDLMEDQRDSVDISSLRAKILQLRESPLLDNSKDDSLMHDVFQTTETTSKDPSCDNEHNACINNHLGGQDASTSPTFQSAQHTGQIESPYPLPSTVPESQGIAQLQSAFRNGTLVQEDHSLKAPQTMDSPTALPQDTQPVSQSFYNSIIARNKTIRATLQVESNEIPSHATLNEGDGGHVDLVSIYSPGEDGAVEENGSEAASISPTQTQLQLPRFPASQRFKTPGTAGKKRRLNGDLVDSQSSPVRPRNPFANNGLRGHGKTVCLSQIFADTQAASSPPISSLPPNLPSDRPSPNIAVQIRPARASTSSPLLEYHANPAEPASHYRPMHQSQDERVQQAYSEELGQESSEHSSDDDFEEEPSILRRRRRFQERQIAARLQLNALSSPTSPRLLLPRSKRGIPGKSTLPLADGFLGDDKEQQINEILQNTQQLHSVVDQRNESEDDTDLETQGDVAVKRSSQPIEKTGEDKENLPFEPQPVPDTAKLTTYLQSALYNLSGPETSPMFTTHHGTSNYIDGSQDESTEERPVVLNSQPPLSQSRPVLRVKQKLFSSGQSSDFVPQSPLIGKQPDTDNHQFLSSIDSHQGISYDEGEPRAYHQSSKEMGSTSRARHEGTTGLDSISKDSETSVLSKPVVASKIWSINAEKTNLFTDPTSLRTDIDSVTATRAPCISDPSDQTGVDLAFDTAQTHVSVVSTSGSEFHHNPQPGVVHTPHGQRRLMTEIAADPSPQRSSSDNLRDMLAIIHDPEANILLSNQSSVIPGRNIKCRNLNLAASPQTGAVDSVQTEPGVRFNSIQAHAPLISEIDRSPTTPMLLPPDLGSRDGYILVPRTARNLGRGAARSTQSPSVFSSSKRRANSRSVFDIQATPPGTTSPYHRQLMAESSKAKVERPKTKKVSPGYNVPAPPATRESIVEPENPPQRPEPLPFEARLVRDELAEHIQEVLFPNHVWACFNGRLRAYYPARCIGVSGAETLRYIVQWDGHEADEIDAHGIRKLDLRIGDMVKVNMADFPKCAHIIKGFKDRITPENIDKPLSDIRGFRTLLVSPKQRTRHGAGLESNLVKEVPVSSIYLDSNMWGQMKDRTFEYTTPVTTHVQSAVPTPTENLSTPSTPPSKRRRTTSSVLFVHSSELNGIFSGMAFAISYDESSSKTSLIQIIRANGGIVLAEGFQDLFCSGKLDLKPIHSNLGFCALLADRHSRKEKYMQALALNLPCLSGKWVDACLKAGKITSWEPFLLPAGESVWLDGATKSRILIPFDPLASTLSEMIQSRPRMLRHCSVIIVMGRGKAEEKKTSYLFLLQALGAEKIERVADIKTATSLLRGGIFHWAFVDDRDVETAKAALSKTKGKNITEVAGNEFIIQSLILGQLCQE